MRKIYDVKCPTGHVNEVWLDNDEGETLCPQCTEVATKQIGAVACSLDVVSGDFPGATDKWLKSRDKKIAREERNKANHGTPF